MRFTLAALLVLTATACRSTDTPPPAPASEDRPSAGSPAPAVPAAPAAPIRARFQCDDLVLPVVFHPDRAVLTLADREVTLPQAVAASGARYSDGATTFWNKGNEATFEVSGVSRMCRELPDAWQATGTSVGPVRIGMTPAEVAAALGAPAEGGGAGDCVYLRSSRAPAGVSFMVAGGRVARVDVTAAGVPTDAGIAVGATEAQVGEAYGARAASSPHKYTDGRYFTVTPDADHRIVFETDGRVVTRYRVGRVPEVQWVEGCS